MFFLNPNLEWLNDVIFYADKTAHDVDINFKESVLTMLDHVYYEHLFHLNMEENTNV